MDGEPRTPETLAGFDTRARRAALTAEAFRKSLIGLRGVGVEVEPLNADAERDGLTRADLQTDVEATLREGAMTVLPRTELFAFAPGTPFLHLDVITTRLDGRYAYAIRLELWQSVRLTRDPAIQTLAITWSRSPLLGTIAADHLAEVREVVRSAVAELIAEVTPRPRDESPACPPGLDTDPAGP